jgi:hypothetical protein
MSRPPVLEVAPETWMRVPEWGTYAGAVTCVVYAIFWVFIGVWVAAKFAGEGIGVIACVLFFFGIAGVCATLAVRIPRAGLWIDADGVTVRGVIKTTRVPLRAVEGFAPRDLGMVGAIRTTVGVTLRRRRQRDLIVWSMRHGEFTGKAHREKALARWQPVCNELNELVSSFPDAAVAPTPSRPG